MQSWCVCGGLLNGLDQDFDLCSGSLLRWHSLLNWSYGLWWFKEVRNGVRDFVCVIPGCAGLFSSDAWSRGSIGILATSLGFAKCFYKHSSISQVNFVIWRSFLSLEVILQPFQSLEIISQPFQSSKVISQPKIDFAAHFIAISLLKSDFAAQRWFCSCIAASKWGKLCYKMALVCQKVVSQLRNTLPNGVSAAKFLLNFARSSSNDHNFFISNPNRVPFEAMDSWLPKIWNEISYA